MSTAENMRANRETGQWVPVSQLDNCRFPVGPGEAVAIGATVTRSATPFPSGTNSVRMRSTVDVWVEIGPGTPNAAPNVSTLLGAGETEYFPASPGDVVAVIQFNAAGFLYERPFS